MASLERSLERETIALDREGGALFWREEKSELLESEGNNVFRERKSGS